MIFEVENIKNRIDPKERLTAMIEIVVSYKKFNKWEIHPSSVVVIINRLDLDRLEEGHQSVSLIKEIKNCFKFGVDCIKVLEVVNVSKSTGLFSFHRNPIEF